MPTGKGPLRTAFEDFLETFGFDAFTAQIIKYVRESDEVELVTLLDNILNVVMDFVKDDPQLKALFSDVKTRKHQIGAAMLGAMGQSVAGGVTGSLLNSLLAKPTIQLNSRIRPALIDPTAMLSLFYFKEWTPELLNKQLSLHGFADLYIEDLKTVNKRRLDAPQLIPLKRRFPQFSTELDKMINSRGWHEADLDWLNAATLQFPSVQDIIRFAVREVYNEQQASFLGLDQNFPSEAEKDAERSGLSPGEFRKYWRSHWELPPATMGFEFLHRFWNPSDPLHFSENDLSQLLVALDYAPTWHKRLSAISTSLLTRVDLRRIRKAGLVDDAFMYSEARASGYDDFRAKKIVEWWNWENNQDVIDLTKSQIEKGYKTGVLKLREANDALKVAEPNEQSRQFLFALWDNDIAQKNTAAELDLIEQEYVAGQYDENTLIGKLNTLGIGKTQQATILLELDVKKRKAVKHLTRTEIETLYEHNQIDAIQAANKFEGVGYPKEEVKLLMFIVDHNAQKARAKELLDAQKEQERLANSEIATKYQVAIAEKNVTVAELEAQIADLKVTASQTEDADVSSQITEMIIEIKSEIANTNVEKAQISLQASIDREKVGA